MRKLRRIKPNIRKKSYVSAEAADLYDQIMGSVESLHDRDLREQYQEALQAFALSGDIEDLLRPAQWKRKVVDIEEFLFGKEYMALEKEFIYPSVIEACHELDSDKYVEAVLKGALGTGKTTIANVMLARNIYKISCMRDPQVTFGVQPNSSLVFTIQSVRFNTAKKAVFEEFGQYLGKSPYFSTVYPYDPKVQSQMIFRQNNLSILPVSSSGTGVISMNVLGGILDEMNFMAKIEKSKSANADSDGEFDQAKQLYDTIARRRRSRFTQRGKLPGMLFIVSSSRFPDDFTEKKALESTMGGGSDPAIYVYSHSQWSAKPRDTFLAESFKVLLGTETIRPKILADDETPPAGCEVIDVPMDFRSEFEKDIEGSIRDFAGRTSLSTAPFILKRDTIRECMDLAEEAGYYNALSVDEADLSMGMPHVIKERLRLDVKSRRAVHLDLALSQDGCGLACGHVAGARLIETFNPEDGTTRRDILPVIGIDFVLRITAPKNGEIEIANIRSLLLELRDVHKLPITWVTTDGFQSVDCRQILRKRGFITDYLSVEKAEPYTTLRDAIYEHRVLLPRHQFMAKELAELERSVVNNKLRVDHRSGGSKDCSDAVCGVVNLLLKRKSSWRDQLPAVSLASELSLFGSAEYSDSLRLTETKEHVRAGFMTRPVSSRKDIIRRDIERK